VDGLQTKRQVAKRLNVSERTVTRYVSEGRLPAVRLSPRAVRFDPESVERWIRNHQED
jgi:excisionase family DNA binding protein